MGKNKEAYFFIINPHAGGGKGFRDWPLMEKILKSKGLPYDFVFSEHRNHATALSATACEAGYKIIIAVGGDGTLNEVANGILKSRNPLDTLLGIIPVGSGNDWCRMYKIPGEYSEAIEVIKNRKVYLQDVGIAKCKNENDFSERYFINVAGLGFDAQVVKKSNKQKDKGKSGKALYLLNLLTSLFSYKAIQADIKIDGKDKRSDLFSMNVGICKFSGGGMLQVPDAIADDGLFDVTIINSIGKFEVIRNVKNLYDGSFIKHRRVDTYRGINIKVEAASPVYVEVDGEITGHTPAEFIIVPQALKIISA